MNDEGLEGSELFRLAPSDFQAGRAAGVRVPCVARFPPYGGRESRCPLNARLNAGRFVPNTYNDLRMLCRPSCNMSFASGIRQLGVLRGVTDSWHAFVPLPYLPSSARVAAVPTHVSSSRRMIANESLEPRVHSRARLRGDFEDRQSGTYLAMYPSAASRPTFSMNNIVQLGQPRVGSERLAYR
jgi:hypothetical protein